MKTINFKLGILFLLAALTMTSYNGYSQKSRLTRQGKKEKMNADLNTNFRILDSLLEMKKFVFVADYAHISSWGGYVNPITNFIKVDSSIVVIQPSGVRQEYGYLSHNNGLTYKVPGGANAEGAIKEWKLIKDEKNLRYKLQFTAFTDFQYYDIIMTINAENNVTAIVKGLYTDTRIYIGKIQTLYNSGTYQYISSY